jgi:hypothetical protein
MIIEIDIHMKSLKGKKYHARLHVLGEEKSYHFM